MPGNLIRVHRSLFRFEHTLVLWHGHSVTYFLEENLDCKSFVHGCVFVLMKSGSVPTKDDDTVGIAHSIAPTSMCTTV